MSLFHVQIAEKKELGNLLLRKNVFVSIIGAIIVAE